MHGPRTGGAPYDRPDGTTIVDFYRGTGTDHRGRRSRTSGPSTHGQLESSMTSSSGCSRPTSRARTTRGRRSWTDGSIAGLRAIPDLVDPPPAVARVMLAFYGLRGTRRVDGRHREPSDTLEERGPRWWGAGNHNHLRLTRIIDSLRTPRASLERPSRSSGASRAIRRTDATGISDETARYWAAAAADARTEPLEGSTPR